MARSTFGGTSSDFVFVASPSGAISLASATLTAWSAKTGGSRYTDLLLGADGSGGAASSISVGTDGQVPAFQGPSGVTQLWLDAGAGRILMYPAAGGGLTPAQMAADSAFTAAYAPGGTAGNLGTTQGDARYVPNAGAVEGVPAQVYGDSFAASDFSSTGPATRWTARAMRRLGFGSMVNLAAAGAWMQDAASRATGTPPSTLPANSTGVILLHSVLNDVLNATPTATKRLNGFKNALLAFLLLARASTRIESSDASFVYSGAWATNTIGDSSGGSIRQTSTGGSCTITIDGGAPVTVDLSNACGSTGSGDVARTWTPIQVPFYGLANVAHTVVVTDTSTGGKSTYLDNLLVLRKASKSPQVVLFKGEYCTAVGYANYGVSPTPTNATVDTYNALIDTVLAGLDSTANITALDPNAAGWNPATMTGAQTSSFTAVHPNDLGEAFLGDLVTRSLAALPYRQGLNV
jgi:hypothetical protein